MKCLETRKVVNLLIASAIIVSPVASRAADIVDTAVAAGSFKTLAAALDAGELVQVLKGKGPFTVFAPTDEAFAKLPPGTVESLLKPENKKQLASVLTYHVVAGRVPANQVVKLSGAKTVNGQRVDIRVQNGTVAVDQAKVVKTDIECSNGIIHVIDSVILPSGDNLVDVARKAGDFGTLLAAAKAAGLVDALTGQGPLTVFAPTDAAFAALPAGTVDNLLKPENRQQLANILKYHVVNGRVYSEEALAAKQADTLLGKKIRIRVENGAAKVNAASLVATDVDASNGVIHVIDAVLLPPTGSNDVSDARRTIENAIAHGSRVFNAGHHSTCANLYMNTVSQMVHHDRQMPASIVSDLRHVMTQAQQTHCATQRAWTLRHGLDRAYSSLARH